MELIHETKLSMSKALCKVKPLCKTSLSGARNWTPGKICAAHRQNKPTSVASNSQQAKLNPHAKKEFKKLIVAEQYSDYVVAIMGYNYKSRLHWYSIPSSNNGKMETDTCITLYRRIFKDIERHHGLKDFHVWEKGKSSHTTTE